MRGWLLAGCCIAGILSAPRLAFSQEAVECTNCTDEATTVVDQTAVMGQWSTQIKDMFSQIQLQTLISEFLSGLTNVMAAASQLNGAGNFNTMSTFGNVPNQLQGGSLNAPGAPYYQNNQYFMPGTSNIPQAAELAALTSQQAIAAANMQGINTNLLNTSMTLLKGLMQLMTLIDAQPSNQLMAGMHSRITAYQGNISSQSYQLQQAQAFAQTQQWVFKQQADQAVMCSGASWANNTASISGGGPSIGGQGVGCTTGGFSSATGAIAGNLNTGYAGTFSGTNYGNYTVPAGYVEVPNPNGGPPDLYPSADFAANGSMVSSTGGISAATQLPVPPIPPDDLPVPPIPPDSLTNGVPGGAYETPAVSNADCIETTDENTCGGITQDDTAGFDPTVNQTATPDPTITPDDSMFTVMNEFNGSGHLPSWLLAAALLAPRRRRA